MKDRDCGIAGGVNPILPLDEYIADGEPHVFGDRIYLFGSHDREGGLRYCAEGNYIGWSAPLTEPDKWECAGVIYSASQDPAYVEGETNDMYAPDVVRGNDGRYYLYYTLVSSAAEVSNNKISIAVSDMPVGKYTYYGYVCRPDGLVYDDYLMSDPAVINDEGTFRLYFGWSLSMVAADAHARGVGMENEDHTSQGTVEQTAEKPQLPEPGTPEMKKTLIPAYEMMFHKSEEEIDKLEYPLMGANTVVLADDMKTVCSEIKRIVPGQFDTPRDSEFYGHAFYEAASIRKINGKYYFIYSSENSNELCYAVSEFPDREFHYGGTIISNGDVGYHGRRQEDRLNMTANDHGSLECINGQWYIFHHRQTHKSTFSRQACAEKVSILPDGSIPQVECTSMGLRKGLLPAHGEFPAVISCVLTNGHMPHCTNTRLVEELPCITDDGEKRFIAGIADGTRVGYKYFDFQGTCRLTITCRSSADCVWEVATDQGKAAEICCGQSDEWRKADVDLYLEGKNALYFIYHGKGNAELLSFALN